jgi:D-alanyl-D-alanine carboxypeptidase
LTWDTKLRVSKNAASQRRSKLYVEAGTSISVNKAVRAIIIKSANDVATVVAEYISGSEREFAKLMTKYARKIGMKKTVFKNASGLNNRAQLTTAYEMAILSRSLISKFPNKYKLFNQKNFTWKDKTYKTHNRLMLKYEGADGIKTGYLASSGFQLALSVVRNNQRLIGVYFGGDTSKQRDQRLTIIMDKVFNNLQKKYSKNKSNNKKTASDKYKIVVGTFKYKKNAEKQIKIIKKNYPKTTDNKEAKIIKLKIGNGYLYETRFQFYSKKEAKYACSRLKMYDRDCFIRG